MRVAFTLDDDAPPEIPTRIVLPVDAELAEVLRRNPEAARVRLLVRDTAQGWAMPIDADETVVGRVTLGPVGGRPGFSALLVRIPGLTRPAMNDTEATAQALAKVLVREVV